MRLKTKCFFFDVMDFMQKAVLNTWSHILDKIMIGCLPFKFKISTNLRKFCSLHTFN